MFFTIAWLLDPTKKKKKRKKKRVTIEFVVILDARQSLLTFNNEILSMIT
jgi:hypothetical protein